METVGSWFIPGAAPLCPSASPHSQFGSPISLSPSHGCERYSTLRTHRSAPYSSPYTHRTNSPSEYLSPPVTLPFYRITPLPSPTINKKLKQTLLSWECFAFLWLLCERSLRAVNSVALHKDVWDSPLSLSGGLVLKHTDKTKGDKLYNKDI